MKSILSILVIISSSVFASATSSADTIKKFSLEFETLIDRTDGDDPVFEFDPGLRIFHHVRANPGALGGFLIVKIGNEVAQSYGGFSLAFPVMQGELELGFGTGLEVSRKSDDRNPFRLGTYLNYTSTHHLLRLRAEAGAANKEFNAGYLEGRYAWIPNPLFELGVMGRQGLGFGPRIDFRLHRPGFKIWASPLYNPETKSKNIFLTFGTGY